MKLLQKALEHSKKEANKKLAERRQEALNLLNKHVALGSVELFKELNEKKKPMEAEKTKKEKEKVSMQEQLDLVTEEEEKNKLKDKMQTLDKEIEDINKKLNEISPLYNEAMMNLMKFKDAFGLSKEEALKQQKEVISKLDNVMKQIITGQVELEEEEEVDFSFLEEEKIQEKNKVQEKLITEEKAEVEDELRVREEEVRVKKAPEIEVEVYTWDKDEAVVSGLREINDYFIDQARTEINFIPVDVIKDENGQVLEDVNYYFVQDRDNNINMQIKNDYFKDKDKLNDNLETINTLAKLSALFRPDIPFESTLQYVELMIGDQVSALNKLRMVETRYYNALLSGAACEAFLKNIREEVSSYITEEEFDRKKQEFKKFSDLQKFYDQIGIKQEEMRVLITRRASNNIKGSIKAVNGALAGLSSEIMGNVDAYQILRRNCKRRGAYLIRFASLREEKLRAAA